MGQRIVFIEMNPNLGMTGHLDILPTGGLRSPGSNRSKGSFCRI